MLKIDHFINMYRILWHCLSSGQFTKLFSWTQPQLLVANFLSSNGSFELRYLCSYIINISVIEPCIDISVMNHMHVHDSSELSENK